MIGTTGITTVIYEKDGGSYEVKTDDKVFLLSIDEAEKFFADDEDRLASPTEYAKAKGVICDGYIFIGPRAREYRSLRLEAEDPYRELRFCQREARRKGV